MEYNKYYIRKELPSILLCSDTTVQDLTKKGRLNKIKVGKSHSSRVFYLKTEVEQLRNELILERLNRKKFDFKDISKILHLFKDTFEGYPSIEDWILKKLK